MMFKKVIGLYPRFKIYRARKSTLSQIAIIHRMRELLKTEAPDLLDALCNSKGEAIKEKERKEKELLAAIEMYELRMRGIHTNRQIFWVVFTILSAIGGLLYFLLLK